MLKLLSSFPHYSSINQTSLEQLRHAQSTRLQARGIIPVRATGPTCKQERAIRRVEVSSHNARKVNHLPFQKMQALFLHLLQQYQDVAIRASHCAIWILRNRVRKNSENKKVKGTVATWFNQQPVCTTLCQINNYHEFELAGSAFILLFRCCNHSS